MRIYIDENLTIHEGVQAEALLEAQADQISVDPRLGVARVDHARWENAQSYERRTWMEQARRACSDRNEYHRERFANYAVLQGRIFERGIELGCGPFTNLRLILERCRIGEVHLLDPLIGDYLHHPFCTYRRARLGGVLNETAARLTGSLRHPRQAWQRKMNDLHIGGCFGRRVTTVESMIETYTTATRFDLVVMINVLEHCQDAMAVLGKIDEILAPGGILVYQDKMYEAKIVKELLSNLYDAGHPLRVDGSVVDEFLSERFTSLMRAEFSVHNEFLGIPLQYTELYYIGRKGMKGH